MEEYPILTKFFYTAKELHEEYGLSIEGVLPKDLTDEDLPDDQWLTVFKQSYQKNAKIYLNQVHPRLVEDCRFLFHRFFHLVGRSLRSLHVALLLRDAMRQQRTLRATKSHG